MTNWKEKIKAYSLKNAIEHDGKAQESSVISALFHEGLKREEVKSVIQDVKKIVSEMNKLEIEEQKKEFGKLEKETSSRPEREGLPELPNSEKGVIMRFSPSPSGPMHIGHAATGMPTSLYVKKYGGKFYLRIEDTNPENIDKDAYKMIPDEAGWLFGNVTECYAQSGRMQKYYDFAFKLIEKGAAYVCTCDSEKFKEQVEKGRACPCRELDSAGNLERWKKMLDKKGFKSGEAVLRFKSDLDNPNPALRDFPLARIIETPHPKQKKKYRVWPLMNLAVTADDIEFGVTHIIRAKDHRDNAKRQEMIYKSLGIGKKFPWTAFLGRYNFTNLEISCSKTKKLIEDGKFSGWDDIRLPFVAALKKRGYQPEAFARMAEQRGLSEVDKVLSQEEYFEILDNFNREILHETAKQAKFVKNEKGKIKIIMPDASIVRGESDIKAKDGETVHFKSFGYAKLNKKDFWFAHK
jgi:glutamyl-tRNA synthetase